MINPYEVEIASAGQITRQAEEDNLLEVVLVKDHSSYTYLFLSQR